MGNKSSSMVECHMKMLASLGAVTSVLLGSATGTAMDRPHEL